MTRDPGNGGVHVRTALLLAVGVFLVGCRDDVMPTSKAPGAAPQQLEALHAGNLKFASRVAAHVQEVKKLPASIDALRAWGTGAKAWDAEDERILVDPWGGVLVYWPDPTDKYFTLRSPGPDRTPKTDDDLIFHSGDKTTRTFKDRNTR
jgi:hypothetical protein